VVLASAPPHLGAQYHDRDGRLPREHDLPFFLPCENDLHRCVPRDHSVLYFRCGGPGHNLRFLVRSKMHKSYLLQM